MINILHLSAVTNWGGGENHITSLCTELAEMNSMANNIILCARNGRFEKKLAATQLTYESAPLAFKMDIRYAFHIIKMVKKYRINIIHIHDPIALALVVIADKFYNLPQMVFSKKTSFPIKQRKSTLYKYNYPKIKKILCVSDETKRVAAQAITDIHKLITVYHGTQVPKVLSEADNLRIKLNIPTDKAIIGLIGNHIEAKDLNTFIETAHIIINQQRHLHFVFVQIGTFTELTPALLNKVKTLQLENHIHFTGHMDQASSYFPQFDLFLMTSQSEGIPQAIYESFYFKVPVVTTNVGGIPEIVEHNVTGLLSKAHDAVHLAKNIVYLFQDKQLQNQFTSTAYTKLINRFTTRNMAIQTLQVYKDILQ